MIDSTKIHPREIERSRIAEAMAEFERQHGPVKTLEIICGTDKRVPFVINNPEKPKAPKRKPASMVRGENLDSVNAKKKKTCLQRVEQLRTLAATGAKIADMAEAIGIHRGSVMRLMRDHDIKRGPKMDLEA